jgi:hypothetical protein
MAVKSGPRPLVDRIGEGGLKMRAGSWDKEVNPVKSEVAGVLDRRFCRRTDC